MTSKRLAGAMLVVVGALALWEGGRFPFGTMARPGPAYMPTILSLVLIAVGVVLILARADGPPLAALDWGDGRHALAILGVCIFIALTLERLGWRLSVAAGLLVLFGLLERLGVVFTLVLTFAVAFGSFFLFNDLLKVPLPRGAFGF